MKVKKHWLKEMERLVEDARDLVDGKLSQDVFLRETSTRELNQLDLTLTLIQSRIQEARDGRC